MWPFSEPMWLNARASLVEAFADAFCAVRMRGIVAGGCCERESSLSGCCGRRLEAVEGWVCGLCNSWCNLIINKIESDRYHFFFIIYF